MATLSPNKKKDFKIEIGLGEGKEWSTAQKASIKDFIKKESAKLSSEEKQRISLLSIRYRMEEYVNDDDTKIYTIDTFTKSYLAVLGISFKQFANFIGVTDGNLKKYVSGERKFNTDLAMKFGNAFNTSPQLWLIIQMKNELAQLQTSKQRASRYKRFTMANLLKQSKRAT